MANDIGFVIDAVSSGLTVLVTLAFLRLWIRRREGIDLLFSIGMAAIALSFLLSTSTRLPGHGLPFRPLLAANLSSRFAGVLVLLFTYISVRVHGSPRIWRALGWASLTGATLLALVYLFIVPGSESQSLRVALPYMNSFSAIGFGACSVLSFRGFLRHGALDRVFVPAAFLCFGVSSYTFFLLDVTRGGVPLLAGLLWRLVGAGFLATAVLWPILKGRAKTHATP